MTMASYIYICTRLLPDALANIPAAYLACEGAAEGAECALPGPQFGRCVRDTLCQDIVETAVDECVLCVDECWASEDGAQCIRPWSGEMGVCETQDQCTDPPETSFEECRRCVLSLDSGANVDEHDLDPSMSEGCIQPHTFSGTLIVISAWLMLMVYVYKRSRLSSMSVKSKSL